MVMSDINITDAHHEETVPVSGLLGETNKTSEWEKQNKIFRLQQMRLKWYNIYNKLLNKNQTINEEEYNVLLKEGINTKYLGLVKDPKTKVWIRPPKENKNNKRKCSEIEGETQSGTLNNLLSLPADSIAIIHEIGEFIRFRNEDRTTKVEIVKDEKETIFGLQGIVNYLKTVDWPLLLKQLAPYISITLLVFTSNMENGIVKELLLAIAGCCGAHALQDVVMSVINCTKSETQSGDSIISSIACAIWCYYTNDTSKNLPQRISSFVKNFGTLIVPFDILLDKIMKLVNCIFDGILERLGISGGSISRRVELFHEKCKLILDQFEGDQLAKTKMVAAMLDEAIKEGESIITTERTGAYTISYYLRRLHSIKDLFATRKLTANGLRVEPIFANFRGAPGLGKTNIVQHLSDVLAKEYLTRVNDVKALEDFEQNPTSFTFNRTAESEYWEGYDYRKIVTFFDDLGQMKDVAGNPDNEWMNLIRAVNEHEYPLHMATMSKKADTFFISKYVLSTTNQAVFKPESITSIRALLRRIDFDVIVTPKPEFTTEETKNAHPMERTLDKSKLPKGVVTTRLDPTQLLYTYTNKNVTKVLEFDELVLEILELQKKKELYFEEKLISKVETTKRLMDKIMSFKRESTPDLELEPLINETQSGMVNSIDSDSFVDMHIVSTYRDIHMSTLKQCQFNRDNNKPLQYTRLLKEESPLFYQYLRPFMLSLGYHPADLDEIIDKFVEKRIDEMISKKKDDYDISLVDILNSDGGFSEYVYCKANIDVYRLKAYLVDFYKDPLKYLRWIYGKIADFSEMIKPIAGMILCSGALYMAYKTIKLLFRLVFEYFCKGSSTEPRNDTRTATKSDSPQDGETQALDLFDDQTNRVMDRILRQNCYNLVLHYPDDTVRSFGQVTFICTGVLLLPQHYISQLKACTLKEDITKCYIVLESSCSDRLDIKVSFDKFAEGWCVKQPLYDRDIGVVYLKNERALCDIRKYFFEEKNISKNLVASSLLRRTKDGITCMLVKAFPNGSLSYCSPPELGSESWTVNKAFAYRSPTRKGYCGMLLVDITNRSQVQKILGMHVAGVPSLDQGYSTVVTQEDLALLTKEIPVFNALPGEVQAADDERFDKNFLVLENLSNFPRNTGKSAFQKTPMYDKLGKALKSLSLLHPIVRNGEKIDPLLKGLSNYGQPDAMYDHKLLVKCAYAYREFMEKNSSFDVERRLMSEPEIIFGIPGDDSFNSMNRQSSMGYPWNTVSRPGLKGKELIFGKGDEFDIQNENYFDFKRIVDQKEELLKSGERPEFYFCDNLKDEKLKKEKVKEGKTRVFSAANCELVYLSRKYFGAFQSWYIKNKMHNGSAIGVNVYSEEWDMLARNLLHKGISPNAHAYGAGDYSKFDGSEKAKILWEILYQINIWYGDSQENQLIRERLWYEVTNSIHVVDNTLVMWTNSLPSGHPMTSIINSMYNNIAFRYCWARLMNATTIKDIRNFDNNVYLITLGDDNLFAVSPQYREQFNESALEPVMAELGLTYTSDTKDGVNKNLRTLFDVTFLKRKFRFEDYVHRYVAPLDYDTAMQISYFCKKNMILEEAVLSNLETTIKELSLYGKPMFLEQYALIEKALRSTLLPDMKIGINTWESALDLALSESMKY